ncbi:MAG: NAD(P)H-dependent oxidoreductase subunit E [Gracilibacteraceae bacterium]|jgi:NADH:ubiquinone oxidoreductase subunit E|nr:NAD(P)H-dependent oxidoreductase subunit E [Gracilibacteraceae bacterium]
MDRLDEKAERLKNLMAERRGEKGFLIPLLQEAQKIYGYLPRPVMEAVAEGNGVPVAEVYGVVTFYAQFRLEPAGENLVRCCMGTACHVRGALKVLRALEKKLEVTAGATSGDGRFTLETVNCIGACGLAPVLTVNDKVFGGLAPETAAEILDQYE